jgi:hypothetical protein
MRKHAIGKCAPILYESTFTNFNNIIIIESGSYHDDQCRIYQCIKCANMRKEQCYENMQKLCRTLMLRPIL